MPTAINPDPTNPDHYKKLEPEPIAVIEKWNLGFHLGNALKYIARAGRKSSHTLVEDLKKARWYLNRQISEVAPDIVAITTSVTFEDAAERLERALVDLENAQRDAEQWKATARTMAQRLRNLRGIDDPEIQSILGPAALEPGPSSSYALGHVVEPIIVSRLYRYVVLSIEDCVPGALVVPFDELDAAGAIASCLNADTLERSTQTWCSALHAKTTMPKSRWCVLDSRPDLLEADRG